MSPPCKWKLSSLVSNNQPLTGALLQTFVTHLFLFHLLSAKKSQNKGGIFFVSLINFSFYKGSLNFFLRCSCLSFKQWTSSSQNMTIHCCSFGHDLWVCVFILFSSFPVNYVARKPIALERAFCYLRLLSVMSVIRRETSDRDIGCAV